MVPEFTVAEYSQVIKDALDDSERYRMLIHDLPRRFHEANREQQARALEPAPPLTGTRWDVLLAGMAEHLAMLHEHPVQGWMNERERFLDLTWILSEGNPVLVARSLIDSPAAFLRHGALPDPRDLDVRGGERPDACLVPR